MMNLFKYDLWLFDCDGVILQSNQIKSQAMYQVALHFSDEQTASTFQQYHQKNAGVTRFIKFKYLFETLLAQNHFEDNYQLALTMFGELCVEKLIESSLTKDAVLFLNNINQAFPKIIISAGTQIELQHIFSEKGLDHLFSQINGGPRTKFEIFTDVLAQYPNATPLYFGDAEADYIVAKQYNIDFVFVSGYSEFSGWKDFFKDKKQVKIINDFSEL